MSAQAVFFIYAGFAFAVALVSLVWGSHQKITGAALLLGSIVISNIVLALLDGLVSSIRDLAVIYASMDLILASVFVQIFADKTWLARNRWAGYLATIHLAMAGLNAGGAAHQGFGHSWLHGLMLNGLLIVALLVCLLAFIPKSFDEARGVAKMKWKYFLNDLFGRMRLARKSSSTADRRSKASWLDIYIGARIRDLRKERGLHQEDLAGALGVSQPQVNRIETGECRTTSTQLFAVSQLLGVDMNYFTEGADAFAATQAARPAES